MKCWRVGCLMIVFALCLSVVCSAAEDVTGTVFSFSNENAVAEENISYAGFGDKTAGYTAVQGDGLLFASVDGKNLRKLEWTKDDYDGLGMQAAMTGGNKNPWGEGAYLEVRVSTLGWEKVTFSAQLGATKKGPRDYQLQYSLDGETYQAVGGVRSLSNNRELENVFRQVTLPADAAGQETLYIRMAVASDVTVSGESGLYGSTSGEMAVGKIVVSPTGATFSGTTMWIVIGGVLGAAAIVVLVIVLIRKNRKKSIEQ